MDKSKFDLQLFADGDGAGTDDRSDKSKDAGTGDKSGDGKTFTQEDVNRIVSDRLGKQQKDLDAKLEAFKTDLEKQSKLSAEEKEKELLAKNKKDLEEKERELNHKQLELDTIDLLKAKELPLDFKPFVIGADKEVTEGNIKAFDKLFKDHLAKAVEEKLKGTGGAPNSGGGTGDKGVKNPWAKDTFNLTEQGKLLTENPELAKQFIAATQ